MTGREYIAYILENGLEDEEIISRKGIVGYLSDEEAAAKFGVGVTTIHVWVNQEKVKGFNMNGTIYIPFNAPDPRVEEVANKNNTARILDTTLAEKLWKNKEAKEMITK